MLGVKAEQSQSATLALSVGEFLSHKMINLQELRISTYPLLFLLSLLHVYLVL